MITGNFIEAFCGSIGPGKYSHGLLKASSRDIIVSMATSSASDRESFSTSDLRMVDILAADC